MEGYIQHLYLWFTPMNKLGNPSVKLNAVADFFMLLLGVCWFCCVFSSAEKAFLLRLWWCMWVIMMHSGVCHHTAFALWQMLSAAFVGRRRSAVSYRPSRLSRSSVFSSAYTGQRCEIARNCFRLLKYSRNISWNISWHISRCSESKQGKCRSSVSRPVKGAYTYYYAWMNGIMYPLLSSYTLIVFLKVLIHSIMETKSFVKQYIPH